MLAVTGYNSRITQELLKILPANEAVRVDLETVALTLAERYLFCHGILNPKAMAYQTREEMCESFYVNAGATIAACDRILAENKHARICIVGSESGYAWSFDGAYAAAKAALHRYVETKKLYREQQLVCIAPSIIKDAGMTTRRNDKYALQDREEKHPKGRFLMATEVAQWIHFVLYVDKGYFTNQVIRLNGGENVWK